ncbi:MAG: hypothetical protein RMJ19_02095, partial [Gemmatales bacterium]|nr:hypothetical protein [Gemmatales bacterium]MDW8174438.1 hypothetical protein [Gemmatales bacterium]
MGDEVTPNDGSSLFGANYAVFFVPGTGVVLDYRAGLVKQADAMPVTRACILDATARGFRLIPDAMPKIVHALVAVRNQSAVLAGANAIVAIFFRATVDYSSLNTIPQSDAAPAIARNETVSNVYLAMKTCYET